MRTALCVAAVVLGALAICSIQDGVSAAPASNVEMAARCSTRTQMPERKHDRMDTRKMFPLVIESRTQNDACKTLTSGSVTIDCCENFKTTRIPHKRLISFTRTVGCSTPSIIFTNRRKMRICTRASEKWVQNAVAYLEKKLGIEREEPTESTIFQSSGNTRSVELTDITLGDRQNGESV